MAVQKFYRAAFEMQLTGSPLSSTNCGAASGAMLADQATLGRIDPSPEAFRRKTGDMEGGLTIGGITTAMEDLGIPVTSYDDKDDLDWARLMYLLRQGRFAVVSGDYDALPDNLKGDKDFEGFHSVMYHEVVGDEIRVGDPLNDGRRPGIHKGWTRWPLPVARSYVERFADQTAGGLYAVVMESRKVKVRVVADIMSDPSRHSRILATVRNPRTFAYSDTVKGEIVRGNAAWFRVWTPGHGIAFVHSSLVFRV